MDTKHWVLQLVGFFRAHLYSAPFIGLIAGGLGLPLPEEFFLIMSGYVCHLEGFTRAPYEMMIVTLAAVAGGDTIVFLMGRHFGRPVFDTRWIRRVVSVDHQRRAERFLSEHGRWAIMAVRFMPGLRMPSYVLCGALGVPFVVFIGWDGLAMIVSVPIQVYLAWRYGAILDEAIAHVAKLNRTFMAAAAVVALILYWRWHVGSRARAQGPAPRPIDSAGGVSPTGAGASDEP
jgi:membrane protein DedA with SNARE-associated domain